MGDRTISRALRAITPTEGLHVRMKTSDFDYDLPEERIAQEPAPVRDASGEVRYAIGVVGMFRQVYSEDFLLATRLVCEAGSAISRAIGYRP